MGRRRAQDSYLLEAMNCPVCGRFMKKLGLAQGQPPEIAFETGGYEWRCVKVYYDGDDGGFRSWAHE